MGAVFVIIFVLIGLFAGFNALVSGEGTVGIWMILIFGGAAAYIGYLMHKGITEGQTNTSATSKSVTQFENPNKSTQTGSGRLDAKKTLETPREGTVRNGQGMQGIQEKPKYENYKTLPDDIFD